MERTFTNALKKQLKQRIKGDLSVHIVDDTLIVDIKTLGCYIWHYTIDTPINKGEDIPIAQIKIYNNGHNVFVHH